MPFYDARVLVLRPPTRTNRAGETTLDYAGLEAAAGFPRDRVHVRPISQVERIADDREVAVTEWRIATEPGSGDWDVNETDWVRLPDGSVAAVIGDASRPTDPVRGGLHHVEVLVRKAGS